MPISERGAISGGPDLPYAPDRGRTHWEGCWSERGHHNCAVAHIYALNQQIRALLAKNEQLRSASREDKGQK